MTVPIPVVKNRSSVEIVDSCNNCFPSCCAKKSKHKKTPTGQAEAKTTEIAKSTLKDPVTI